MFDYNYHKIPFADDFYKHEGIEGIQNDPDIKCWAEDWHTQELHDHLADGIGDILQWFGKYNEKFLHDKKFLGHAAKSNRKNGRREWANKPSKHTFRHSPFEKVRRLQDETYQNIFKLWMQHNAIPKDNFDFYEVGKNWTVGEILASTSRKVNLLKNGKLLHHNLRELTRWNQMIQHCNNSDRLVDDYGNPFDASAYKIGLHEVFQKNMSNDEWQNILPDELKSKFEPTQTQDL